VCLAAHAVSGIHADDLGAVYFRGLVLSNLRCHIVVGLVLGVALATGETIAWHGEIANNICQYLKNKFQLYACQLTKPLISKRFPQSHAMKKSCGQRQLPTHGTTKPPRNQTFKRLVIPYKVGDEGKRREKQKQREEPKA
jgi:hypothetical protein